jgi:hypothetical protein
VYLNELLVPGKALLSSGLKNLLFLSIIWMFLINADFPYPSEAK